MIIMKCVFELVVKKNDTGFWKKFNILSFHGRNPLLHLRHGSHRLANLEWSHGQSDFYYRSIWNLKAPRMLIWRYSFLRMLKQFILAWLIRCLYFVYQDLKIKKIRFERLLVWSWFFSSIEMAKSIWYCNFKQTPLKLPHLNNWESM